jgi:hypothetical protein
MNRKAPATVNSSVPAVKQAAASSLMINDVMQGNTGFENMGADDIAIPFMAILQALSPQVRGTTRIKNAEEGDFYNSVTQEIIKGDIRVIPCAYQKCYVEWKPRDAGGGFIRQHNSIDILDKTTKNERNQDVLPSGNHIVTTAYQYSLLVKEDSIERVVISFTSTQLKKSRRWNSQMMSQQIVINGKKITPPMYAYIYKINSIEESNDQGSWAGWEITSPTLITETDLYLSAKKFHDDVTKGAVKTAPPSDVMETVPPVSANDGESEHF